MHCVICLIKQVAADMAEDFAAPTLTDLEKAQKAWSNVLKVRGKNKKDNQASVMVHSNGNLVITLKYPILVCSVTYIVIMCVLYVCAYVCILIIFVCSRPHVRDP